jgi:tRNA dimethylallyltransferase
VRARLDEEAARDGVPAQHARLATLDPETAARLKPNDSQRIQRALEIIELTGRPMSALLTQKSAEALPFTLLPLALEPSDRAVLHERIARRFDLMLENHALLDEVRTLRERGDLHLGLPSMRCVGYRQAWEYLDGQYDYAEMRERGIIATRQLAKRQLTWLRSMPERIVIDCNAADATRSVLAHVRTALTAGTA